MRGPLLAKYSLNTSFVFSFKDYFCFEDLNQVKLR